MRDDIAGTTNVALIKDILLPAPYFLLYASSFLLREPMPFLPRETHPRESACVKIAGESWRVAFDEFM